MVIDSDDEEDESAMEHAKITPAEFEKEEDEIDPLAPYHDIIRYIDIPLGAAGLRVATPHIVKDIVQAPPESWPSIYLERIVIAVACADSSIRVISAPLDPPAPEFQDVSTMDIHILKIFGPNSHQDSISDIAITHAPIAPSEEDRDGQPVPRSQTRSQSKQRTSEIDGQQWSLLVASISCTGTGLLLVHQFPLQSKNKISTNPEHSLPIRRQYLRSSSLGARLAFNTSPCPAERHTSLLITLPASSCVKLFQVCPTYSRERRGSTATVDSGSSTRSSRTSSTDRGKFLITFLPPFVQDNTAVIPRRKRVLDAQWIVGGRAVVALLEDGEWGIWDLEAVGPTSSTAGGNLIRGQGNLSGIHGGSLTKFAVRSNISPSTDTKKKSKNIQTQPTSGSLAPMTPSTRRIRSENLFQGGKGDLNPSGSQLHSGSIYVEECPSNRPNDDSITISYASENVYISSILSFWKSDTKPTRLPTVRLGGQQQRSFSLLHTSNNQNNPSPGLFGLGTRAPDFLIQTNQRLILSVSSLTGPSATVDTATQTQIQMRPFDSLPQPSDQTLLASGELDIDGMDRILDDMGGTNKPKPMNLFNKSVGFRIDDDDVDMGSPTPANYSSLKMGRRTDATSKAQHSPQRRIFT